ncbi:MAG: accessory factor UbiK family protein [Alphaproteobacteria bacterium]
MTQTSNRLYDRMARLMNDAANVAQGVRREASTMVRGQAERMVADMDLVRREDFEAVKEMARLAREENAKLEARIAKLEGKSARGAGATAGKRSTARKAASAGSTTKPRTATAKTDEPNAAD